VAQAEQKIEPAIEWSPGVDAGRRRLVRWGGAASTLLLILTVAALPGHAQRVDPTSPENVAKGRALLDAVIAARGGAAYLSFRTLLSTGQYTPYQQGLSQVPVPFVNYLAFPDRERVEFGKGKRKNRRIQVNQGQTGWVYDGEVETIKDQTEEQLRDYLESLTYDLDRVLRERSQDPRVQVGYAGLAELRPGERAEILVLELGGDKSLTLTLDRTNHLPLRLTYESLAKGTLTQREVRFFQYVPYDGVFFPNIIDFYRNGIQESRVNYQSIRLGIPVRDELFLKPASVKAIK
jgi:hypothetical protein